MKVIVVKDKVDLGEIGEVVNVKDGYARNYLLPRKMVIEATSQNLKTWDVIKKQRAKKTERIKEEKEQLAAKLNGGEIKTVVETGSTGKLYGSINNQDVAVLIKEQIGVDIDRHRIILSQKHIKDVGSYVFQIKVYPEVTAEMKLIVEGKLREEPKEEEEKKPKKGRGRKKRTPEGKADKEKEKKEEPENK